MAVVQISRIQLRRGRKRVDTGMPQLASGELAWAIDTQELFIGNGSIGEGAPYVGNTKVLTEHDNLLEIVKQYQYRVDDFSFITGINTDSSSGSYLIPSSNFPIKRSLQDRLDEGQVNARSFGIIPLPYPVGSEETIDTQTARIKNALDQLFNSTNASNVSIIFDPGLYQFNSTIEIPENSSIFGSGKDKTVFEFVSSGTAFQTKNDSSRITLENFTIKSDESNTIFLSVNDSNSSIFKNIKFVKSLGSTIGIPEENTKGIDISQVLVNGTSKNQNIFEGLEFFGLTYGVYSNNDSCYNFFKNCFFRNLFQGINLGLEPNGSSLFNSVVDSVFDTITESAILVGIGHGNNAEGNKFFNVGSDLGGIGSLHSIIKYNSAGNSSINNYFERTSISTKIENADTNYFIEVIGAPYSVSNQEISIPPTLLKIDCFRLPLNNFTGIEVNYNLMSVTFDQKRKGTLYIAADANSNNIQLVDEYEYIGELNGEDSIIFSAEIKNSIDYGGSGDVKFIVISYINKNTPTDNNLLTYNFTITS